MNERDEIASDVERTWALYVEYNRARRRQWRTLVIAWWLLAGLALTVAIFGFFFVFLVARP